MDDKLDSEDAKFELKREVEKGLEGIKQSAKEGILPERSGRARRVCYLYITSPGFDFLEEEVFRSFLNNRCGLI